MLYVQEERLSEGRRVIRLDCCRAEKAQRNRKIEEVESESSPLLSSHSGHRYPDEVKMATVMELTPLGKQSRDLPYSSLFCCAIKHGPMTLQDFGHVMSSGIGASWVSGTPLELYYSYREFELRPTVN